MTVALDGSGRPVPSASVAGRPRSEGLVDVAGWSCRGLPDSGFERLVDVGDHGSVMVSLPLLVTGASERLKRSVAVSGSRGRLGRRLRVVRGRRAGRHGWRPCGGGVARRGQGLYASIAPGGGRRGRRRSVVDDLGAVQPNHRPVAAGRACSVRLTSGPGRGRPRRRRGPTVSGCWPVVARGSGECGRKQVVVVRKVGGPRRARPRGTRRRAGVGNSLSWRGRLAAFAA